MVRKVMRLPAVLEATGWAKPTLYAKIAAKKCPPGKRLDPDGRAVIWFENDIEAVQNGTWKPPVEAEAAA